MPFGDKSLDNEHIGYLTSAQALADYARLVNFLQGGKDLKPKYPVIAFGGKILKQWFNSLTCRYCQLLAHLPCTCILVSYHWHVSYFKKMYVYYYHSVSNS